MFSHPTNNILFTYEKSTKKAAIFIESIEAESIFKYYVESKTNILKKSTIAASSIESIEKSLNQSNPRKFIDDDNIFHKKHLIAANDSEILTDLLDSRIGKQIDSDHIDNYKGIVGEVHELEWAQRTLEEVGISIEDKFDSQNNDICLIL